MASSSERMALNEQEQTSSSKPSKSSSTQTNPKRQVPVVGTNRLKPAANLVPKNRRKSHNSELTGTAEATESAIVEPAPPASRSLISTSLPPTPPLHPKHYFSEASGVFHHHASGARYASVSSTGDHSRYVATRAFSKAPASTVTTMEATDMGSLRAPMSSNTVYPASGWTKNVLSTQRSVDTSHSQYRSTLEMGRPSVTEIRSRPGEKRILNEYTIERQVVVPRKQIREDIWEKTYVVPERVVVEEIVEDTHTILEKIVEVATPIVQEKVVEVPVYDFVEKTIEVPQKVVREKIVEVPRVQLVERVVEVPRYIDQEKVVEMPYVEYQEVTVEKIVEVPEIREKTVYKEVEVPQYVDRPVREERRVEVTEERTRLLPVPVESKTRIEFTLPKIRPVYANVPVPLYVPRFVEVPVPMEFCDQQFIDKANEYNKIVCETLEHDQPLSLAALEKTAQMISDANFEFQFQHQRFLENFAHWWRSQRIVVDAASLRSICTVTEQDGCVVLEAVSVIARDEKMEEIALDDTEVDEDFPEETDNKVEDDEGTYEDEADEQMTCPEDEPPIPTLYRRESSSSSATPK